MTTQLAPIPEGTAAALEAVVMKGDLTGLSASDRLAYYRAVCESVGLNPLTRPFDYITLNSKVVLYAKKDATDQLADRRKLSRRITDRQVLNDIYLVTAEARTVDGRIEESTGAVSLKGKSGDDLANAYMKAETKAKRRVTLSICGLGMLDETEIDTIPGAKVWTDEREAVRIPAAESHQIEAPQQDAAEADFYRAAKSHPRLGPELDGLTRRQAKERIGSHLCLLPDETLDGMITKHGYDALRKCIEDGKTIEQLEHPVAPDAPSWDDVMPAPSPKEKTIATLGAH